MTPGGPAGNSVPACFYGEKSGTQKATDRLRSRDAAAGWLWQRRPGDELPGAAWQNAGPLAPMWPPGRPHGGVDCKVSFRAATWAPPHPPWVTASTHMAPFPSSTAAHSLRTVAALWSPTQRAQVGSAMSPPLRSLAQNMGCRPQGRSGVAPAACEGHGETRLRLGLGRVWIWLLLFLEAPTRGTSALPALLGSPSGRCSLWPKHKDQGGCSWVRLGLRLQHFQGPSAGWAPRC